MQLPSGGEAHSYDWPGHLYVQMPNSSLTLILLGNRSVECEELSIKCSSYNLVQYGIMSSLVFLVVSSSPLTRNASSTGARL